ncbi:unnamed protein product, partial [Pseudo-nitzschia multistriata]
MAPATTKFRKLFLLVSTAVLLVVHVAHGSAHGLRHKRTEELITEDSHAATDGNPPRFATNGAPIRGTVERALKTEKRYSKKEKSTKNSQKESNMYKSNKSNKSEKSKGSKTEKSDKSNKTVKSAKGTVQDG